MNESEWLLKMFDKRDAEINRLQEEVTRMQMQLSVMVEEMEQIRRDTKPYIRSISA